jgi:hypothetical protein
MVRRSWKTKQIELCVNSTALTQLKGPGEGVYRYHAMRAIKPHKHFQKQKGLGVYMIKITTRQLILLANTYSVKSITRNIYIIKRGKMKYTLVRLV